MVAFGECCRVGRNRLGIVLIGELPMEPARAAIVHKVNNWGDAKILDEVRDDLINPTPVELALLRFDAVPWNTPAQRIQAQITCQCEIFTPVLVMAHQFILVERPISWPNLG